MPDDPFGDDDPDDPFNVREEALVAPPTAPEPVPADAPVARLEDLGPAEPPAPCSPNPMPAAEPVAEPEPAAAALPPAAPVAEPEESQATSSMAVVSLRDTISGDPVVQAISAAGTFADLADAIKCVNEWTWSEEHQAAINRAKTYIRSASSSPDDVLCGFFVTSLNEWRISQPRVIVVARTAYYRVSYDPKSGKIDHYHKGPLSTLRVLEKTATNGVKFYLTVQDGKTSVSKMFKGLARFAESKYKGEKKEANEFEHSREYHPLTPTAPLTSVDAVCDAFAAIVAKAAELLSMDAGTPAFTPPSVITTEGRKQILANRAETARLEKERVERESASAELSAAIEVAKSSRAFDGLSKPLRRCKRAVDVDPTLIEAGEALKLELEEEKRENERLARLEAERLERETAGEELKAAVAVATESRDFTALAKPIRRAKKAVDFDGEPPDGSRTHPPPTTPQPLHAPALAHGGSRALRCARWGSPRRQRRRLRRRRSWRRT